MSRYILELGRTWEKNVDYSIHSLEDLHCPINVIRFFLRRKGERSRVRFITCLDIRPPSNWRSLSLMLIELQLRVLFPPLPFLLPHLTRVSYVDLICCRRTWLVRAIIVLTVVRRCDQNHQGERKLTVQNARLLYDHN